MDVKHNMGGDMEVMLNPADISSVRDYGFCMIRIGLVGFESKTCVRTEEYINEPLVEIDGDNDVNIYVPKGTELPLAIPHDAIKGLPNEDGSA